MFLWVIKCKLINNKIIYIVYANILYKEQTKYKYNENYKNTGNILYSIQFNIYIFKFTVVTFQ